MTFVHVFFQVWDDESFAWDFMVIIHYILFALLTLDSFLLSASVRVRATSHMYNGVNYDNATDNRVLYDALLV
jgi:hypothetical protein